MRISLPPSSDTQLVEALTRTFSGVVSQNEASARVLLQSPNGSIWSLTVDDAGVLSVTAEDGKSRL